MKPHLTSHQIDYKVLTGYSVPWLGAAASPVADAVAAHTERLVAYRKAAQAHTQHVSESNRSAAMAADRRALTAAMVAGKRDPGDTSLSAWENEALRLYRRCVGLGDALAAAHAAVRASVGEHGDEWLDNIGDATEQVRAELDTALADVEAALSRLDTLAARRGWVSGAYLNATVNPAEGSAYRTIGGVWPSLSGPRRLDGEPFIGAPEPSALIARLRSYRR